MKCKFSIPKEGKKAIWEITNQCNYLCKYCIFASNPNKDNRELSLEECKCIINELVKNEFSVLKITGGEPFLRKDLIEIIAYAKSKNMTVDVSTNASLINEENAKLLKQTNITKVHVSLDGYNKNSQEYIRGTNTFERTLNGIRHLKNNNLYVRIGTVIYKNNENNIEDIVKFVIDLNVDEIIFSIMEPEGRMKGDYTDYKIRNDLDLQKEIEKLKEKYKNEILINYNWSESELTHINYCPAGTKFIFINNLGYISPCTWISNSEYQYSLKEKSLKEILDSEEMKEYSRCRSCVYKN